MSASTTVATLTDLKAISVASLPTNSKVTVATPGTGLLPYLYMLVPSTLAEIQPFIIRPNTYTTRLWVAQPGAFGVFSGVPSAAPPFVGYFWVNSSVSPRTLFASLGTSSVSDWKQI